MDTEGISIKISPKNIQCYRCIFAGNPKNCACAKFKIKPSDVLYEGAKCPKFKELFDEDNDFEEWSEEDE